MSSPLSSEVLPLEEIAKHGCRDDLWIVLDGEVYDMTSYIAQHPGGDAILRNAGGDASSGFHSVPAHKYVKGLTRQILQERQKGKVQPKS